MIPEATGRGCVLQEKNQKKCVEDGDDSGRIARLRSALSSMAFEWISEVMHCTPAAARLRYGRSIARVIALWKKDLAEGKMSERPVNDPWRESESSSWQGQRWVYFFER